MCTNCARAAGFGQDQHQHHLLPLDDGGTLLRGLSACLPMRLRGGEDYSPGGRSSLAGTGRVADLWDVHKFSTRDQGMVAVFRHHALGTALELCEANLGMASFVENDTRNASVAMAHGRVRLGSERRNRGYTPLVRDNRTWWDLEEGFLAPDTLEALRDEAGSRPMVAEWFDVGEGSGWEAFDDGSQPHVHITNSDAYNEIFLTANGALPQPGSVPSILATVVLYLRCSECVDADDIFVACHLSPFPGFIFVGAPAGARGTARIVFILSRLPGCPLPSSR